MALERASLLFQCYLGFEVSVAMNSFDESTVDNVETWACEEANKAGRKWGCKVADLGSELEIQFIGMPEVRPIKIPSGWLVEKQSVELRRHIEDLVRAAIPR